MRLRNKETGKIGNINLVVIGDDTDYSYDTFKSLNDEWEEYTPKEPLIKNKEIRNMIKLWARYHNSDKLLYLKLGADQKGHYLLDTLHKRSIDVDIENLGVGVYYTLEELCGEEE